MNDIEIFRGQETTPLDFTCGYRFEYDYQPNKSAGGLKPAALACASVTGSTLSET
jgi:hypothetical protein